MHGYMISKIIGDIIGPFRCMHWGALYPLLGRLEQTGMVRALVAEEGAEGHKRKVYAITDAGRERLREHLLDTHHHLAEYDSIFAHKVGLFSQLSAEERVRLSRHYAVYTQRNIDHLEHERSDLLENAATLLGDEQLHDILAVMAHRIQYWEHERAWAEELIEQQLPEGDRIDGTTRISS
jgi:DNA-binding PadR family transcriptional regulator